MAVQQVNSKLLPALSGATSSAQAPLQHMGSAPLSRAKFTDQLRTSIEKLDKLGQDREQDARDAANQLVSMAFIKPLLAQTRESPFKSDMFHGGHGEEVFQQQLDSVLADRMAERLNVSIADAVYRKFSKQSAVSHQQSASGARPAAEVSPADH